MHSIQSVTNFHKAVCVKIGYSAIQELPVTQYRFNSYEYANYQVTSHVQRSWVVSGSILILPNLFVWSVDSIVHCTLLSGSVSIAVRMYV